MCNYCALPQQNFDLVLEKKKEKKATTTATTTMTTRTAAQITTKMVEKY